MHIIITVAVNIANDVMQPIAVCIAVTNPYYVFPHLPSSLGNRKWLVPCRPPSLLTVTSWMTT